jgi:hypothetical protein
MALDYDEIAQEVCRALHKEFNIAGVDVGGTYDAATHTLVWMAQYSVRDEKYVKGLISMHNQGLKA